MATGGNSTRLEAARLSRALCCPALFLFPFLPTRCPVSPAICERPFVLIRAQQTQNLGMNHQTFGGPSNSDATNDPSPLDAIREQTSKIEDWLDTLSDPLKP